MKNGAIELVLRREVEVGLILYFSGVKVRPHRLHQRLPKITILRIVVTIMAYNSSLPINFVLC